MGALGPDERKILSFRVTGTRGVLFVEPGDDVERFARRNVRLQSVQTYTDVEGYKKN